jgi:hypothetical protein
MITHGDLCKALWTAYVNESKAPLHVWEELTEKQKACWSAVANAAWDLIDGENAEYARHASDKLDELQGLIIEFMNRAEDVIG